MEDAFTMGKNAFYVAKEVRKGYAFTGLESIETYISNFLVAFRKNLKNKIKIPIVNASSMDFHKLNSIKLVTDYAQTGILHTRKSTPSRLISRGLSRGARKYYYFYIIIFRDC